MRIIAILTAVATLALGACDKGKDEQPGPAGGAPEGSADSQSAEQVLAEMKGISLMPGEWETTSEVTNVVMEGAPQGMPPGLMDAIKGRKTTVKSCISPEQAKKPDASFLTAQKDSNCTYSGFSMSGGAIKGTVTCPGNEGHMATVNMEGTYTPTSYAMNMEMSGGGMGVAMGGGPAGAMTMRMTLKTTGKRIGDCPGS